MMELRKALIATTNKSILVIEDIDCSQAELQDRNSGKGSRKNESEGQQVSISAHINTVSDWAWWSLVTDIVQDLGHFYCTKVHIIEHHVTYSVADYAVWTTKLHRWPVV